MVFGREGAYVLANGKIMPTLRARSGAPQRWRIVNAAKSRFFLLDLDGQQFYVIGSDGGLQERPVTIETLLVTPGERADVIVTPTRPQGGTLTLRARSRTTAATAASNIASAEDVLTIAFTDEPTLADIADAGACIATSRRRALAGATPVDIVLDAAAGGPDGQVGVPSERRAVLEGQAVPARRSARRRSGP